MIALQHGMMRGGTRRAAFGLGLALAGAGGGCDVDAEQATRIDGGAADVAAADGLDGDVEATRGAAAALHAPGPAMCMDDGVSQEPSGDPTTSPEARRRRTAKRLARALDARMTVWKRADGSPIHVAHCRALKQGCRARIVAFAEMFADAAIEYELDPFLVAAVAVKESALSPLATGPRGSAGILQLNPRGVGQGLRFVRSPSYRAWCTRHRVDACQQEIVDRGAKHLSQWIDRCDDVAAGLGGYNTGQCGRIGYSRRVIHIQKELMDLAEEARGADRWITN